MVDSKNIEQLLRQITDFIVDVPLPPGSPEWENRKRNALRDIVGVVEILIQANLIIDRPECPATKKWFPPMFELIEGE